MYIKETTQKHSKTIQKHSKTTQNTANTSTHITKSTHFEFLRASFYSASSTRPGQANFFWGPLPELSTNIKEILPRAPVNFEEQKKFLETSITIINYLIIINIISNNIIILLIYFIINNINHHHLLLPPWIRSFVLFQHRRIAIVSWGFHDILFLEVCSWGLRRQTPEICLYINP